MSLVKVAAGIVGIVALLAAPWVISSGFWIDFLTLTLFIAILDLHADDDWTWRRIVGAASASLALALIHPIAVPIAFIVLGAYLLLLAWRERRIPWREIAGTGLAGSGCAPRFQPVASGLFWI